MGSEVAIGRYFSLSPTRFFDGLLARNSHGLSEVNYSLALGIPHAGDRISTDLGEPPQDVAKLQYNDCLDRRKYK
jgi:hypothetical protein